jgi:hypothetical protein
VARKKDAEEDFASKAILDQLQTKTVGAPPSTTGLTGDQLPQTIFDVADFETVKNQVTLQLSNLELLNVLNTIGQVTNTQSQSGPIPKTSKIVTATATGSSQNVTFFTPNPGEVWSIQGFAQNKTGTFTAGVTGYLIVDDGNQSTSIDMAIRRINSSTADPQEDTDFGTPVFVDENMTVKYRAYSTGFGDSIEGQIYCVRVR